MVSEYFGCIFETRTLGNKPKNKAATPKAIETPFAKTAFRDVDFVTKYQHIN
jgi:hypothetical protein